MASDETETSDERAPTTSGVTERALVTRWLTSLSLVQSAEFLVQREADVAAAVALITADAASESLLGLIGSWSAMPHRDRPTRGELIDRAVDALNKAGHTLDAGLLTDSRSTHMMRNGVVHHGATATRTEAARAVRVARSLLDLVPLVSDRFAAIPSGGGVASGVALVIATPDIADQLRKAGAGLAAGDAGGAMDAAARALGRLWYLTKPALEGERRKREHGRARAAYDDPGGRLLIEDLGAIRGRIDGLIPWIVGPAVGLQPAEYSRLTEMLGHYILYDTFPTRSDDVHRGDPPTLAEAQWATERVAQVVYRLWETDVLQPSGKRLFTEARRPPGPDVATNEQTPELDGESGAAN